MANRKVFHSFDYKRDAMRVQQVKQIGALEGQPLLSSNDWEKVERQGEAAIKRWIDQQMADKDCLIVLIGSGTAGRKWVDYEIVKAWNDGKGVVGIYIHNLKHPVHGTSAMGKNPFDGIDFGQNKKLSAVVKAYNPSSGSPNRWIEDNIEAAVEEAIQIRKKYS